MRRFLLQVLAGAIGLLAVSAHAQRQRPPDVVGAGTIAILTDGIVEPNGRATLAVNELAGLPRQSGNVRVLPVAGHGAAANVRDLLHLRGVDLAILNSDVLAFLEHTAEFPQARRRLRYITHLFDQKIYLLVSREFRTIEDLRGRKLAILSRDGGSHTTATTLFGLQKIDVTLEPLGSDAVLDDASIKKFDGALLLSGDLTRVRLSAQARQELRALPIVLTSVLQNTYRPAVIDAQELAGFAEATNVETVAVSTLLAVFNWTPSQARHANVANFVRGLFAALPELRKQHVDSIWQQVDVNVQIPGWTRHAAAEPSAVLGKAQLAALAVVERPQAGLPPPAKSGPAEIQRSKVRVLAIGRSPLADEHLPDGGLILALVNASLSHAGPSDTARAEIDVRWTKAASTPIVSLLSDPSIHISLPLEGADCERPNDLAQASAVLCDLAIYSDPILQVIVGLFTLSDSAFKFDTDESIFGKTICIPQGQDVSALNGDGRNWLSQKRVAVLRQPTLVECVGAVQRQEADAFVANDLEGRYLLGRLGLTQLFRMTERPLGTRGVHAVVSREHVQASELINALNRGLKQLKQSDAYSAIVRRHVMKLWDAPANKP